MCVVRICEKKKKVDEKLRSYLEEVMKKKGKQREFVEKGIEDDVVVQEESHLRHGEISENCRKINVKPMSFFFLLRHASSHLNQFNIFCNHHRGKQSKTALFIFHY